MDKFLDSLLIIGILMNIGAFFDGTRVYDSFVINLNYIMGALW